MITLRFYGTGDNIEFNFDKPFDPITNDTDLQIFYNKEKQRKVKYSECHPIIWFLNFFFRNITTDIPDQSFQFNKVLQELEKKFDRKYKDDFKKFIVRAAIGTCGNDVLIKKDFALLKKYYDFLTILGKVIFLIDEEHYIPIDPECEIKNFFRERYEVFYGEKLLQCLDGFKKKLGLTENFPEGARLYCNPISITEEEADIFEKSLESDEWPEEFINKQKGKCVITSGEDEQSVIQAILTANREFTDKVLLKNTELENRLLQQPKSLSGEASGANPAVSQAAAVIQETVEDNLKELEDELIETKKLVEQLLQERNTAMNNVELCEYTLRERDAKFGEALQNVKRKYKNEYDGIIQDLTSSNREKNEELIGLRSREVENSQKLLQLIKEGVTNENSLKIVGDAIGKAETLQAELEKIKNELKTVEGSNEYLTHTNSLKDNEISKLKKENEDLKNNLELHNPVNAEEEGEEEGEVDEEGEKGGEEEGEEVEEGGEDESEEGGKDESEEGEESGEEDSSHKKSRGAGRGRGAGGGRGASGNGGMTRTQLTEMVRKGQMAAQAQALELQKQRQLANEAQRRAEDALQRAEEQRQQAADAQNQAAEALMKQLRADNLQKQQEVLRVAAEAAATRLQTELDRVRSGSPPGSPSIASPENAELQAQLARQQEAARLSKVAEQTAEAEARQANEEARQAKEDARRAREIARVAEEARRKAEEDLRKARNSTPPGSPVPSSAGSTPPGSPVPGSPGTSPVVGPGMTTILTKTFDRIVETNRRLKETLGLIVENQNNKEERNRENALWRKALHEQINEEMSLEECVELLRAAKRRMHELRSEFTGGGKKK